MTCSTNSYGIEVRFPENWHQDNPRCEHGPMLLFEKYTKGKAGKRFYACSACRDRKDCNAFIYENDYKRARLVSMSKERSHLQHIRATYEEIVECDKSERCFCVTCQMIVILKKPIAKDHSCRDHKLRRGITEKDVLYASRLLFAPLEHNSKNAQYFLNGDCTEFLLSTLVKLRFSKVLCIGMPTLHENIQALKPSQDRCKIDSLLLDIDSRFAQSNPAEAFCHFNMFNHHIFDDSLTHLKAFLSGVETSKLAVVLDPPFGGLVDAIAETLKWIFHLHVNLTEPTVPSDPKVLWIFPYFMEKRICSVLENIKMLDYQVHYENHRKFKKKDSSSRISPVRIFTNIKLEKFILPVDEGYRFCKICNRYVFRNNLHCTICNNCASKDGKTYVHCNQCRTCVKPGWLHCEDCRICRPRDHRCQGSDVVGCHHCGKLTHKRRNCPIASIPHQPNPCDDFTDEVSLKRPSNVVFHPFSSHIRKKRKSAAIAN